jgi:hypothetical protein
VTCPLSLIPFTNYWVVAAGTYEDLLNGVDSTGTTYDWAIIMAGQPNQEGENDLCYSSGGVWILSHDPVPSTEVIGIIDAKALSMDLDTSEWLPAEQAGAVFMTISFRCATI